MDEPHIPDTGRDTDDRFDVLDLQNPTDGRWLVGTSSGSHYEVTAEAGEISFSRTPAAHPAPGPTTAPSVPLRRDGARVAVVRAARVGIADDGETSLVDEIRVGFPVMWITEPLADDAACTVRITTDVVAIVRLA